MGEQIEFFEMNYLDKKFNPSIAVSSGTTSVKNMRDRKSYTKWITSNSDDLTTETIEINFNEDKDVDFIHLSGINWKKYQAKYWDGGSTFIDFSPAINVTAGTLDTVIIEPTEVSTQKVKFYIDETIVADEEKEASQVIVTNQLGKLDGWPVIQPAIEKKLKKLKKVNGRESVIGKGKQFKCKIKFNTYPEGDDIDLVKTLQNRTQEFLVWVCGGDENQFKYDIEPFRLQDIYLVNEVGKGKIDLTDGIYTIGYTMDLDLQEV